MSTRGSVGFVINNEEKLCYNHSDSYPDWLGVRVLQFLREFLQYPNSSEPVDLTEGTLYRTKSGRVLTEADIEDAVAGHGDDASRPKEPPEALPERLQELRRQAAAIRVVSDEESPATPEEILSLRETSNWFVNQFSMAGPPGGTIPTENVSWYNLLRETQGDLGRILQVGFMEDGSNFPLDSLFCEWAYVVDLDQERLEVYEGFQKELPKKGRWAGRPTPAEDDESYQHHLNWCAENGRDPWKDRVSQYKAIELVGSFPLDDLPDDATFIAEVSPPEEDEE